ncbi:MAG: hypothetical protein HC817_08460 [Saprospiraceae bacterium]|nr:hypothetical protein [Saprospiraceae bacterium]
MDIYDRILKEDAPSFLPVFFAEKLGIDVKTFKVLPTEMNITQSNRTDIPCLVSTFEGEELIVHVEFQSDNDPDMPFRMNLYKAMLVYEYRIKVRQIVIFFGENKPTMATELPDDLLFKGYELVYWKSFPYQDFLKSNNPELVVLSLLADFGDENPQKIIESIMQTIISSHFSENAKRKWVEHLLVLARLRKLVLLTKKIVSAMPIVFDITTDELYLEGLEKGIEKGIRLELKRGDMSLKEIAEYFEVSIDFVLQVKKRLESEQKP